MTKITKLIVLNGSNTMSFTVGRTPIEVTESKVKKIQRQKDNHYIVFLQDGNELDILSDRVITHTKVGMF